MDQEGVEVKYSIFTLPEELIFPEVLNESTIVGFSSHKTAKELLATNVDGTVLWRSHLNQSCHMGAVRDNVCWLYGDDFISCIDAVGREYNRMTLGLDVNERIGTITLCGESIIVSVYRVKRDQKYGVQPRIVKLTTVGKEIWSTMLPVSKIAYSGCQYMGGETGWKQREMPAWTPENWLPFGDDQLLISDDRVLASFQEMPRSGIGCRYVLCAKTGQLLWKSNASPIANAFALSYRRFLMGVQGYGAFETYLYEDGVDEMVTWRSHGHDFVTKHGTIMSIQMSNDSSVPQHVVELCLNGSVVVQSKRLPGYYTSKPVQLLDGSVYFWRGDHVWSWNQMEGLRGEIKIGLGDGAYASTHKFTEQKICITYSMWLWRSIE